jgi:hypothetical protein
MNWPYRILIVGGLLYFTNSCFHDDLGIGLHAAKTEVPDPLSTPPPPGESWASGTLSVARAKSYGLDPDSLPRVCVRRGGTYEPRTRLCELKKPVDSMLAHSPQQANVFCSPNGSGGRGRIVFSIAFVPSDNLFEWKWSIFTPASATAIDTLVRAAYRSTWRFLTSGQAEGCP